MSLFGGFIPKISSQQDLEFGTFKGIFLRILSRRSLELDHDSVNGTISLE